MYNLEISYNVYHMVLTNHLYTKYNMIWYQEGRSGSRKLNTVGHFILYFNLNNSSSGCNYLLVHEMNQQNCKTEFANLTI